jgi:hypothetical protein
VAEVQQRTLVDAIEKLTEAEIDQVAGALANPARALRA